MNRILFLIVVLVPIIIAVKDGGVEINTDQYKQSVDTSVVFGKDFYLVTHVGTECANPSCGGFNLTPLNNDQGLDDIYVSEALEDHGLDNKLKDYSSMHIDSRESNVIVAGTIKDSTNYPGFKCIQVTNIFRSLQLPDDYNPLIQESPSSEGVSVNTNLVRVRPSFYMMKSSPFMCNRIGKCPPISTLRLNTDDIQFISTYDEPYTSTIGLLDKVWLTSRLVSNDNYNAIVKGVQIGENLKISRVYIGIQDPQESCPRSSGVCDHSLGLVPVFTRDKDRCSKFDTCVPQGPCHLMIPHCPDGYSLSSVISGPKACSKWYCDPSFLPNTNQNNIHFKK